MERVNSLEKVNSDFFKSEKYQFSLLLSEIKVC